MAKTVDSVVTESWVELFALLFIVIGFIIAVILRNPTLTYTAALLSGGIAARGYYAKKYSQPILPFVLMIVGFVIGYLIGGIWVSRFWLLISFGVGFAMSYYLHMKKIFAIFKSENFVK